MTETIFLLENTINETELFSTIEKTNDLEIFTLDYESHNFLNDRNISHTIADSFLTNDLLKNIDDLTIHLTEKWNKHELFLNYLEINGVMLPRLLEPEFLLYFRQLLLVLYSMVQIIDKLNPKKILCSTSVNDFVREYCKSKNIEINLLKNSKPISLYHEKINIKFSILRLPISFNISRKTFLKLLQIKKYLDIILNTSTSKIDESKKSILLLNFDTSNYEELLLELSKSNLNIFLLNQRKPAFSNFKELGIIRKSKCKTVYLDDFRKNISTNIQKEKQKLLENLDKIWANDTYFEKFFSINNFSFWNSIKKQFVEICTSRFLESTERILLLNEFFTHNKISTILEWAEVGQEEQECISLAKKFKIHTIMLQHGKYPISKKWDSVAKFLAQFPAPLSSDKQAVWGNFTKEYAIRCGHNEKNLIVSGSPRHDKFFNFSQLKHKSNNILFATTGPFDTSADTSTTSARLEYENYVKEVCRIVSKMPEKKLLIKPHPSSKYTQDTLELLKKINLPHEVILNANIPNLIAECDLLITFNNSTIALDSIIMGVPVISIQTGLWAEEDEIVKMNAVKSITELGDLEKEISNVLNDSQTKKYLYENGRDFLESYMEFQGTSSKNFAHILSRI